MDSKMILYLLSNLIVSLSFSQDALRAKHFNLTGDVAVQGYDPVGYFVVGKAVKGNKDIAISYGAVRYYFATMDNRETFRKNPSAYEPQYGGWCAYAMGADGSKVEIDPNTFKIINGKLYLFYNKFFNNTLKSWNKNETVLKHHADANWEKLFK